MRIQPGTRTDRALRGQIAGGTSLLDQCSGMCGERRPRDQRDGDRCSDSARSEHGRDHDAGDHRWYRVRRLGSAGRDAGQEARDHRHDVRSEANQNGHPRRRRGTMPDPGQNVTTQGIRPERVRPVRRGKASSRVELERLEEQSPADHHSQQRSTDDRHHSLPPPDRRHRHRQGESLVPQTRDPASDASRPAPAGRRLLRGVPGSVRTLATKEDPATRPRPAQYGQCPVLRTQPRPRQRRP